MSFPAVGNVDHEAYASGACRQLGNGVAVIKTDAEIQSRRCVHWHSKIMNNLSPLSQRKDDQTASLCGED